MEIDESVWILEFLLRQTPLQDQTLKSLVRVLPIQTNNYKLNKTLLLRQLQSDIQKASISERTLELLEQIEHLDHIEGVFEVSESMKAAYCTVAMHITEKMVEQIEGDKKVKYGTVVKRFWSGRVRRMEKCGVKLIHDDLVGWVYDVEAGVMDVDVCENVVKMFTELDVVKSVERFVNEAIGKMGPSFLELACEAVLNDDGLREALGLGEVSEALRAREDEVSKHGNKSKNGAPLLNAGANSKEASKAHMPSTHKHAVSRRSTEAKIVVPTGKSYDKYDCIPSPEVSKVQEALESSTFELHAAVKDPLPDALRFAESLKASMSVENEANNLVGGNLTGVNDKAPISSHDRKGKALEADGDDDTIRDHNKTIKPSLFERNHTAHTAEWSDSIDNSEEESPTRPHLPSPQKRKVSPLSVYKMEKPVGQRKKKRWTGLEEDTLRSGVQKYGKGNWKLILSMYRDIFEDRTELI